MSYHEFKDDSKVNSIEGHVKEIMKILGIRPDKESKDTPYRIAKMLTHEVFKYREDGDFDLSYLNSQMTVFPSPSQNPVTVKNIPFSSMCAHHWMPFFGKVDITYIPNEVVLGLSKFPRVVKFFSGRPQVQENLTSDIGKYLEEALGKPKYLRVVIHDTTHTCVLCRGAESDCSTDTVFEVGRKDSTL